MILLGPRMKSVIMHFIWAVWQNGWWHTIIVHCVDQIISQLTPITNVLTSLVVNPFNSSLNCLIVLIAVVLGIALIGELSFPAKYNQNKMSLHFDLPCLNTLHYHQIWEVIILGSFLYSSQLIHYDAKY